jgi:hypothetical protein
MVSSAIGLGKRGVRKLQKVERGLVVEGIKLRFTGVAEFDGAVVVARWSGSRKKLSNVDSGTSVLV